MARPILDSNRFVYGTKYYRQIRGGAMGSAFTQVLANIYMLEWEHELLEHQHAHGELYGRYIDDIFLTTNRSIEDITAQLEKATHKDVNIDIDYRIRSSFDSLDVQVANSHGQSMTSIFHKPSAEPYVLPYSSDHPQRVHRNVTYAALLRAARLCSNVYDLDMERVHIDSTLLLNDHPPTFISKQTQRFFRLNGAMDVYMQLDEEAYRLLHEKLLQQPSRREKQHSTMIPDHDNEQPTALKPKTWDRKLMYPHVAYESGTLEKLRPMIHR